MLESRETEISTEGKRPAEEKVKLEQESNSLPRVKGDLERIEVREVSRLVNSIRNNGPELIEPAEPEPEAPDPQSPPGARSFART